MRPSEKNISEQQGSHQEKEKSKGRKTDRRTGGKKHGQADRHVAWRTGKLNKKERKKISFPASRPESLITFVAELYRSRVDRRFF